MDRPDYQVIRQCNTLKRSIVLCIHDEVRPLGTFTHEGRFYHHVEFTLSHVVWHRPLRHFSQVKLVARTRISELELANGFSPEITVSSVAQATGNSTEIIQLL